MRIKRRYAPDQSLDIGIVRQFRLQQRQSARTLKEMTFSDNNVGLDVLYCNFNARPPPDRCQFHVIDLFITCIF